MKQCNFFSGVGHDLARTPHAVTLKRLRSYPVCLYKIVILFIFSLGLSKGNAQSGCIQPTIVEWISDPVLPSEGTLNFGICDQELSVTLEFTHEYEDPHEYIFTIKYATLYEDFKEAHDSLSTGRLAYIAEERSKIFASDVVQDSLLELYRLSWYDGMTDLLTLDSLRQAGDTSTSVLQYDSAVLQSTTARTQYADYLDTLTQARKTKIQTLRMQNAWITATTPTPAANHKTVNNIVFNLLLYDTLQTGDLATLASIADMCPLEGGDAVYEARTIVAHFTGASYDDVELCAETEERKRVEMLEDTADTKKIALYPNPTTGQVYWTGTSDQVVRMRVFNAVGGFVA